MEGKEPTMACILSDCPTFDADYQGATGAQFTVTARCATAAVAISGAAYAGTTRTSAPFSFTIVGGVSNLATIVEGAALNTLVQIVEACPGGGAKVLRQFDMTDPDHSISSVRIKGV
jgi:hypothetical protein